ncbi:hypothetical protein E2320_006311, partial [Naja naja]
MISKPVRISPSAQAKKYEIDFANEKMTIEPY